MRSLNDFFELMKHEFPDIDITLNVSGFKVDGKGNGLKIHCGLNNLKSVDYIHKKNNNYFQLIEFKDIYRKQNTKMIHVENLNTPSFDEFNNNEHSKKIRNIDLDNDIKNELVQKYIDTLTMINQMHNYLTDIPEGLQNNPHRYYIVVAPFHSEIPGERRSILSRLLAQMKSRIKLEIPDELFLDVELIQIEAFANYH